MKLCKRGSYNLLSLSVGYLKEPMGPFHGSDVVSVLSEKAGIHHDITLTLKKDILARKGQRGSNYLPPPLASANS